MSDQEDLSQYLVNQPAQSLAEARASRVRWAQRMKPKLGMQYRLHNSPLKRQLIVALKGDRAVARRLAVAAKLDRPHWSWDDCLRRVLADLPKARSRSR